MGPPDEERRPTGSRAAFDIDLMAILKPREDNRYGSKDPLPSEPWTELGYANRLIHVYGDHLLYVPAWKRWLVWDGKRWAHDTTGQVPRWMKSIARLMTSIALAEGHKDKLSAARHGETSHGVAGSLTLASTSSGVAVSTDDLDADPFLLNCQNGVLDLRTCALSPHDPELLLTKLTGAAYDPDATGPLFDKFLCRVQPDPPMRSYLARLLGQSLEGRVIEHILPIFWGPGANGKGTTIETVDAALGDYAAPADPELLTARTFEAHPTGTADLFGLRLAILHESDQGRRLAEGTVKRLTGGESVKARRMRENFWRFKPSHTFVMLTNHKPIVGGRDVGIWRRLRLVPWPVIIPLEEQDGELAAKLAGELDAVLAYLVAGYQEWRQIGLSDPEAVIKATADFRAESDALRRFIDQRCLTGPHFTVRSSDLYADWVRWCRDEGEEPGSQTAFSIAMTDAGFDKRKTKMGWFWVGIGLAGGDDE